jgi:acetyl esterase/lipase
VATRPVFVFVHGGGYSSGDKQVGDLPFHDHVGGWAVRHSMVGVTMNYRLAPNYPWPAGAEDVGTVVEWLSSNISTYGGDPGRIVVAGHSAGASHLAAFLAGQAGAIPREIRAAILLSGVYDVADSYDNAMAESFFGGLKTELIYRRTPGAPARRRTGDLAWIEGWYNPERIIAGLGMRSPDEYEAASYADTQNTNPDTTVKVGNPESSLQ